MISRMECKQETMLDTLRGMDDSLRKMTLKVTVIAAVVSMVVGYVVRDLSWLTALLGGL